MERHASIETLVCCELTLAMSVNRSLLERVLSIRLVYQRASMARALSFEYLNRQLVWHELSELLLFTLPLINVAALKRFLLKRLPPMARQLTTAANTGKHPTRSNRLMWGQAGFAVPE